jgi:hypothetical protein
MSDTKTKMICGIVMPISPSDGCSESHWADVLQIINESVSAAGFEANLVSNADDVGVIHKRIIQNLYDNPVVVCDVSGKNPNVMFELGIRLAFDKPTVIIKDEKTSYSFDTSGIEHLSYPRDLRFSSIVDFKNKLTQKISSTYQKSVTDPDYSTFLKHFGEFKVAKLDQKEVSGQEYIIDELKRLNQSMRKLESKSYHFDPDLPDFLKSQDSQIGMDEALQRAAFSKAFLKENGLHIYADALRNGDKKFPNRPLVSENFPKK